MFKRIFAIFFPNICFVFIFCGCYSSMHQGQVIDGPNIAFALRPLHNEVYYISEGNVGGPMASMAIRYGWAPSQMGKVGHSIGIIAVVHQFGGGMLIGNYYLQFPKNSILDAGIGVELCPLVPLPYIVISRKLGTQFTFYGEVRKNALDYGHTIVPTFGISSDVSKNCSLFNEISLCIHGKVTTPVIGLGINLHRR